MARQKQLSDSATSDDQRHESKTQQGPKPRETSGRGWHGDPQGHANAGSKGGRSVSQNREHMASIGRKGGQAVSRDRRHMAEIGRKGGQARGETSSATQNDKRG